MNSPNLQTTQHGAPDALFDDIEQELLALTTASLDEDEAVPGACVDEFADEYLAELGLTESTRCWRSNQQPG
jgi:hypothetical protein